VARFGTFWQSLRAFCVYISIYLSLQRRMTCCWTPAIYAVLNSRPGAFTGLIRSGNGTFGTENPFTMARFEPRQRASRTKEAVLSKLVSGRGRC
jgi:hypothetical protein